MENHVVSCILSSSHKYEPEKEVVIRSKYSSNKWYTVAIKLIINNEDIWNEFKCKRNEVVDLERKEKKIGLAQQ